MKIIFDSNIWRQVSSPNNFPNDPNIDSLNKINTKIIKKEIEPYISETVFTIESIKRRNRKEFISNYRPQIVFTITDSDGKIIDSYNKTNNSSTHPGNHPILQEHLDDAMELGFHIVRCPRIAGIINPEIENLRYKLSGQELKEYHDKLFEVGEKIEQHEAGFSHIQKIGEKYDDVWFQGISKAPEHEWGNIAKAMAEWADGDSVAISIALDCDYLCTRDEAKGAGTKSVLSNHNLRWLKDDYGFEIISPQELARK